MADDSSNNLLCWYLFDRKSLIHKPADQSWENRHVFDHGRIHFKCQEQHGRELGLVIYGLAQKPYLHMWPPPQPYTFLWVQYVAGDVAGESQKKIRTFD